MHVVYFANDSLGTGNDELWYTSAAAPYTAWDAPVRLTDGNGNNYTVDEFDLAAGSGNTANIAYTANAGANEEAIFFVRNTSAARLTFTQDQIWEETFNTDTLYNPHIVMRGAVAHVVWFDDVGSGTFTLFSSNNGTGGGFPGGFNAGSLVQNAGSPTSLADPSQSSFNTSQLALLNDSLGVTHLVYGFNTGGNSTEQYRYRAITSGAGDAGTFGAAQIISDSGSEGSIYLSSSSGPILQVDGNGNVYVFWKQSNGNNNNGLVLVSNVKTASGSFVRANTVYATDDNPGFDDITFSQFYQMGDVYVTQDGQVLLEWRSNNTYGNQGLFPVYYRTRSAAGVWSAGEVAAWANQTPRNDGSLYGGGAFKSTFVRSGSDGSVHVFYSDIDSIGFGFSGAQLYEATKAAGAVNWMQGGNVSRLGNYAFFTEGLANNYFVDAGLDADGVPSVLLMSSGLAGDSNATLTYTNRIAGQWLAGVDVNGLNEVLTDWSVWAGRDANGKLHCIWQERVDPFDVSNQNAVDIIHSNQQ